MGFIPRFHEIYIVERAGISLAGSFRLRNLHSALTRPNAMEGLVVVSYAKQIHLITSKSRIEWLLRGEGNELTQSQGRTFSTAASPKMCPIACSPVTPKNSWKFKSLALNSISSFTIWQSDPYQFAYKAKRNTLDAVSYLRHAINAHLDKVCKTFNIRFISVAEFGKAFFTYQRSFRRNCYRFLSPWTHPEHRAR